MSDPLADPRATDLLAAVPDDVAAVAASFRTAASEAEMTGTGLAAAQHDAEWKGGAATAFRRSIGRLPHELERVRAGYAEVAAALDAYEPELAKLQSAFVTTIGELADLEARPRPAAAVALQAAHRPTHRQEVELLTAVAHAHREEVERLTARAFALLDDFEALRDACRHRVAAAQGTAPVRPRPRGAELAGQAMQRVEAMIRQADALLGTPYVWGGGHGSGSAGGLDCSGFVSAVLRSGGYVSGTVTTEGLLAQPSLAAGPGHLVTIYDRTGCGPNEHVIIKLAGRFYEAGGGSASGGAPFVHQFTPDPAYLASFNSVLHPVGL